MECGPLAGGALALGPGAPLAKAAAGAENAIKPGRPGMLAGLAYQESLFYEMGHTGLQLYISEIPLEKHRRGRNFSDVKFRLRGTRQTSSRSWLRGIVAHTTCNIISDCIRRRTL